MAASRAAVALPMPLLAPVTSATFGIDSRGTSMPVIQARLLLHRDLCSLDHRPPFGEFASDESLEVFRSASDTLQGVLRQDGLAPLAFQEGVHHSVHLADDVLRRTGRCD